MKLLSALLVIFLFIVSKSEAQTDTIEMHLIGPKCIKICKGAMLYDSGYIVADSFAAAELTITQEGSFVTTGSNEIGVYKLRYRAHDRNGNSGVSEWRIIQVVDSSKLSGCKQVAFNCDSADTIPPKITLIGDPAATLCQCCTYIDSGYVLSDNFDSTKYIKVEQEGSFKGDSKLEGVYSLRYKVTDLAGNFAYSDYRYIFVRNKDDFPCIDKHCCVGIEESDFLSNLNIYPNPAQEELFIETSNFVNAILIYSISGQKISEIRINQFLNLPYKIDAKHFPAGVYMVQVKTALGIIHKKVQINK